MIMSDIDTNIWNNSNHVFGYYVFWSGHAYSSYLDKDKIRGAYFLLSNKAEKLTLKLVSYLDFNTFIGQYMTSFVNFSTSELHQSL